jgi:hypothetical protein
MAKVRIVEAEFRRLWAAGASRMDLAERFKCSLSWVDNYRMQLGLPARQPSAMQECYSANDPTPDQIAERARECRERHYAERRGESEMASQSRGSRCRRMCRA